MLAHIEEKKPCVFVAYVRKVLYDGMKEKKKMGLARKKLIMIIAAVGKAESSATFYCVW